MEISELNIYPVKSLKGIALDAALVEERGLQHDRRWMLVDERGKFLTQREFPVMATLRTELTSDGLLVTRADGNSISVFGEPPGTEAMVQIWASRVRAAVYEDKVNAFFSEELGTPCRLVTMTDAKRPVNYWYRVNKGDNVSFADGYPFLLVGESSLDELNRRLADSYAGPGVFEPLPMNRFRPNFVVQGSEPFAEDKWKRIRIGETVFHVVKPCARCVITTIDQNKGVKTGAEPLRTLAEFRKKRGKVLFAQNLIADRAGGVIGVGDTIEILETK